MIIGRVVDQVIATQKDPAYRGQKLLIVQPLDLSGSEMGSRLLAIDGVDAGKGDRVLVVQEGFSAMHVLGLFHSPVDSAIIAVVDRVDLDEGTLAES